MKKKPSNLYVGVTQKMMSFRLDNDNALWLDSMPNKGRYINWLIRLDRRNGLIDKQGQKLLLHEAADGTDWKFNPNDPDLANKYDGL